MQEKVDSDFISNLLKELKRKVSDVSFIKGRTQQKKPMPVFINVPNKIIEKSPIVSK